MDRRLGARISVHNRFEGRSSARSIWFTAFGDTRAKCSVSNRSYSMRFPIRRYDLPPCGLRHNFLHKQKNAPTAGTAGALWFVDRRAEKLSQTSPRRRAGRILRCRSMGFPALPYLGFVHALRVLFAKCFGRKSVSSACVNFLRIALVGSADHK
jgi:hypothetical protein